MTLKYDKNIGVTLELRFFYVENSFIKITIFDKMKMQIANADVQGNHTKLYFVFFLGTTSTFSRKKVDQNLSPRSHGFPGRRNGRSWRNASSLASRWIRSSRWFCRLKQPITGQEKNTDRKISWEKTTCFFLRTEWYLEVKFQFFVTDQGVFCAMPWEMMAMCSVSDVADHQTIQVGSKTVWPGHSQRLYRLRCDLAGHFTGCCSSTETVAEAGGGCCMHSKHQSWLWTSHNHGIK